MQCGKDRGLGNEGSVSKQDARLAQLQPTLGESGSLDSKVSDEVGNEGPADETMGVLPSVMEALTKRTQSKDDHDDDTNGEQERRHEQSAVQGRVEGSVLSQFDDICRDPTDALG